MMDISAMRPALAGLLAVLIAAPAVAQDQSSNIERVETPEGAVTIVRPARRAASPAPQGPVDPATATLPPSQTGGAIERRREDRLDNSRSSGVATPDIVIIQQRRGRLPRGPQTQTVDPGLGPVPPLRAYEPPTPPARSVRPQPDGDTTIIIRR